jgi:hypothetical protein
LGEEHWALSRNPPESFTVSFLSTMFFMIEVLIAIQQAAILSLCNVMTIHINMAGLLWRWQTG